MKLQIVKKGKKGMGEKSHLVFPVVSRLLRQINPLRAIFFQREHKHTFTFYVIPPH